MGTGWLSSDKRFSGVDAIIPEFTTIDSFHVKRMAAIEFKIGFFA